MEAVEDDQQWKRSESKCRYTLQVSVQDFMNLRSGAFYRSRHYSILEDKSKASTLGSTARTPSVSNQVNKGVNEETLLDSSMDTSHSNQSLPGIDLKYDGRRLRFVLENNHGAGSKRVAWSSILTTYLLIKPL